MACSYAVAIGVFAFLLAIGFIISDLMFNSVSNVKKRRYIVIGDLGCSGKLDPVEICFGFVLTCHRSNSFLSSLSSLSSLYQPS